MNRQSSITTLFACCLAVSVAAGQSPIRSGDRIAIVGNTFADQLRIHGYLESLLLQASPGKPLSIRNLGWGGDMLDARDRPTNFPSEETTLTAHRTDVMIACFGLGESFGGEQRIEEFRSNLTAFIASHAGKKYNGKVAVRLILVSPIAYENLGELTPAHERRNRELQAYTNVMREVASREKVPFVDLFAPSSYLMQEPDGPDLTSNGIHLNQYGYWAISNSFFDQLVTEESLTRNPSWLIQIDVDAQTSTGRGVELSELALEGNAASFLVTETSLPRLPPPTEQSLPPQLSFNRDTLRVENLDAGIYQLKIDGKLVATARSNEWAEGVPIDSSPTHQSAEAFRKAINDKNLQFVYSWKALNQVHIVGERKSSPSGRSLPQEVIEFNRLANERDVALRDGILLKSRRWELSLLQQ